MYLKIKTNLRLWPYHINWSYFIHSINTLLNTYNCVLFVRTKWSLCGNRTIIFFYGFFASHNYSFHIFGCLVPNQPPFLYSLIIKLAIFVASVVQVREESWTNGMRENGSIDNKEVGKENVKIFIVGACMLYLRP